MPTDNSAALIVLDVAEKVDEVEILRVEFFKFDIDTFVTVKSLMQLSIRIQCSMSNRSFAQMVTCVWLETTC